MHPWPDDTRWLGAHIFFNAGIYTGECDHVVLKVAEPFVRRCQAEGWIDGHFFIRYSEFGPHVRLRLHGKKDVLESTVWPALVEHVRALHPDVLIEKPEGDQWRPEPAATDEPPRVTHLAEIEYEPETDRYGGPLGVRMAERFFEHSSETAYALLHKTSPTERSSRLGKGLLSTVVLMHVFCPTRERAVAFARNYGEGYLRAVARSDEGRSAWLGAFGSGFDQQAQNLGAYVEEVWERMDEDESLSEALDAYVVGLKEVRVRFRELLEAGSLSRGPEMPVLESWDMAVGAIVSSYLHMMNNRLGISIQEESYLAYLAMRALEAPVEEAVAPDTEVISPES
ncbi:MAG TPA: thiopeptide-type bacteriocin biosynthesis protein [Longimicrobium sp.]|nr:thiopeptide-type bacteriocin biosynthesis protein [Longimicrobium sp.]